MERRVIYECTLCAAATPATVIDLTDPSTLVRERDQRLLREVADLKRRLGGAGDEDPMATMAEELLDQHAKDALRYATCPRCEKRNPAGVAERAAGRRKSRVVGSLAAGVAAVGVWFFSWAAWVVVAWCVGLSVLTIVVASRARALRWGMVVSNVGIAAGVMASACFYPRGTVLLPLALAVRFAVSGGTGSDEAPWTAAKETIRFETPYR